MENLAVAEEAATLDKSPAFWQTFAAAELSAKKSRALFEELGKFSIDPVSFLRTWPKLSERERACLNTANQKALEAALKNGASIWEEPDYLVEQADQFPRVLFRWGDHSVFERRRVGIVGTRNASTYGTAVTNKIAQELASAGVTVFSGGAAGIDTAAHEGALSAENGRTVAVLPCGIDKAYPAHNQPLFERIRERGCLISQYACGQGSQAHYFLNRNTTLVALCEALVIIEAPEKSGALHSASVALEQGKPIFVVPGNITMFGFRGSHQLIRDGATLVDHPDQILMALGMEPNRTITNTAKLTPDQQKILDALAAESISLEKLAGIVKLDTSSLLAELTTLEIDNQIIRDGIGYALKP